MENPYGMRVVVHMDHIMIPNLVIFVFGIGGNGVINGVIDLCATSIMEDLRLKRL